MLVRSAGADRELRSSYQWPDTGAIPPASLSGISSGWWWSQGTGQIWSALDALALPAVSACVRLVAETIGSLPCIVYRGTARADDTWQYRRLHDTGPNPDASPFDFFADVAASLELYGNTYVEKRRLPDGELELTILDPARVRPVLTPDKTPDGAKSFEIRFSDGTVASVGSDRILHIRGFTIGGQLVGLSPIQLHRRALGLISSQEEFSIEFYRNSAQPGGVLLVDGRLQEEEYQEMARRWRAEHEGAKRFHRMAILEGGMKWQSVTPSLVDSQFAETAAFGVEQVARIWNVPPALLGIHQGSRSVATAEQDADRLMKFCIGPRLRRIEAALFADADLFPPQAGLKPEFLADALLRADVGTRYTAYLAGRQAGWLSANEIRGFENLPPVPGGDEVQLTPVGGAPNPA
jgi:HK97 family phage portal protein